LKIFSILKRRGKMSKMDKVELKWSVFTGIVMLLLMFSITEIPLVIFGNVENKAGTSEKEVSKKDYHIKKITSNILRVISCNQYPSHPNFAPAIKEVSEKHAIKGITPVTYKAGHGSETRELIIRISPRKSSR